MIPLASALFLIGLSDVLHGHHLTVHAAPPRRLLPNGRARKLAFLIATLGIIATTAVASPWFATALVAATIGLWLGTYRTDRPTVFMLGAAAAILGLAVLPILALVPGWSLPDWLAASTLAENSGWQFYTWALTIAAITLVNLTTGNRIVRAVLRFSQGVPRHTPEPDYGPAGDSNPSSSLPTSASAAATTAATAHDPSSSLPSFPTDPAPRAGRVIGVLERYLLIVLVIGGQSLTIAGLAAAKSIIRYPEISKSADGKNGLSAEVFFIGTITSWLFALASASVLTLALR